MKKIEVYTFDDVKNDVEKGVSDSEIALKKWRSILNAVKALEEITIQITSFCLKYQNLGCKGCPVTKFDYPCGHPYASFTIFYQELRKLRMLAENIYAILVAIDRDEKESKKHYV